MLNDLLATYGLPILICGCIAMALVGLLKTFTKKTGDEKIIKYYPLFAILAAALCAAGYIIITKQPFDISNYLALSSAVYACSQALYPLYENYGGRQFFLAVLELLMNKEDPDD